MMTDDAADASSLVVSSTTVFTTPVFFASKVTAFFMAQFFFRRGLVELLQLMPIKATAVIDDIIFPVVVAIRLSECNKRVVWLLLDVVSLAYRDVVHQEPLGCHHFRWVI